jgi:hypothetical protein
MALLLAAAEYSRSLEGDVIECGSYRGGSAGVIGQAICLTRKTLHVCDSFQGLPEHGPADNYHRQGDFADTDAEQVSAGLRRLSIPAALHVGFFEKTLPALRECRFALAHIDVDLYESVRECLEFCYPRLVAGGIIVLDDYGETMCLGAKKAADEFFADKLETPVPLSHPSCGILKGCAGDRVFHVLRKRVGWLSALPLLGPAIYRRSPCLILSPSRC